MDASGIAAILAAVAGILGTFAAYKKGKGDTKVEEQKSSADYAGKAFEAWEALAAKYESELARRETRERELTRELEDLRMEISELRQVLLVNGIPLPISRYA